jgi:hypothetical protein
MFEGYILLIATILLLCFGGYGFCLFVSAKPAFDPSMKDFKSLIDSLLQRGYCPEKVMEIIGYYY